jgi:hypothetical protein
MLLRLSNHVGEPAMHNLRPAITAEDTDSIEKPRAEAKK